jgi:hypothetical protein
MCVRPRLRGSTGLLKDPSIPRQTSSAGVEFHKELTQCMSPPQSLTAELFGSTAECIPPIRTTEVLDASGTRGSHSHSSPAASATSSWRRK